MEFANNQLSCTQLKIIAHYILISFFKSLKRKLYVICFLLKLYIIITKSLKTTTTKNIHRNKNNL